MIVLKVLNWIISIIILFMAAMVLGMGGTLQFFPLLLIAFIFNPLFRSIIQKLMKKEFQWWIYAIAIVILWSLVLVSFQLNPAKSIYKSVHYKKQLNDIYNQKLKQWPVPYESRFIDTKYGKIHVIVSGPEKGYPVMLINASALSAWSWIYNVKELNKKYRTFAIDNIGEGGKNQMIRPGFIPQTGKEIARFYSSIADKLGIKKSHVIGASIGGYISTLYALHAPERVNRVILLGPMGYGFTLKTVALMTLAQGFPFKGVQDRTFTWAFGPDKELNQAYGKWFRIYMKGLVPTPVKPSTFVPSDLKGIKKPVLIYFGKNDGVIGDEQQAKKLALNLPDCDIRIVNTGHIMGIEASEKINKEIMIFLSESD